MSVQNKCKNRNENIWILYILKKVQVYNNIDFSVWNIWKIPSVHDV